PFEVVPPPVAGRTPRQQQDATAPGGTGINFEIHLATRARTAVRTVRNWALARITTPTSATCATARSPSSAARRRSAGEHRLLVVSGGRATSRVAPSACQRTSAPHSRPGYQVP